MTGGTVSVLVLYTPAAAAANNISLMANNIIAQANGLFATSGVGSGNYFTLADMQPLSDDLTTFGARCETQIINNASAGAGAFSNVSSIISATNADIVLIIATTEPAYSECSALGRFGGFARIYESANPFAFTSDTYAIGDLTAIHELGHVMGGDHEGGTQGALSDAYGYATSSCAWQTLMGGYVQCAFDWNEPVPGLQPTTRLPRWSNPSLTYGGLPTGSSTQDMAAALDVLMPDVSAWESNPSAPGTPSGFNVSSWLCYGTHTASWSATSGATHYQLMASPNLTTNKPVLVQLVSHSSGGTSAVFDIYPMETLYLRVRACNAGGCSALSSEDVANDYYDPCV